MMEQKDNNKVEIVIYKNFKRVRAFKITQKLLNSLVILNSILVIGCIVFLLGFLFQWGKNWTITEKNKVLEQELLLLKK